MVFKQNKNFWVYLSGFLFIPFFACFFSPVHAQGNSPQFRHSLQEILPDADIDSQKQLTVGMMYAAGVEGKPDYKKAVEWYQKAADNGNSTAMYLLTIMKIEGLGTQRDYASALTLARNMAEKGDNDGYMLLGMMYESGAGVKPDYEKAVEYYGYASRQVNDIGALYKLGMFSLEGKGVSKDTLKAMQWLRAAADNGDINASYQLGVLHYDGKYLSPDYGKAHDWFAATLKEEGHRKHKRFPDIFGKAAVDGEDYTKRMAKMMGKDLYVKRQANYMLGLFYDQGLGVGRNVELAEKYFSTAASEGDKKAREKLVEIDEKRFGKKDNPAGKKRKPVKKKPVAVASKKPEPELSGNKSEMMYAENAPDVKKEKVTDDKMTLQMKKESDKAVSKEKYDGPGEKKADSKTVESGKRKTEGEKKEFKPSSDQIKPDMKEKALSEKKEQQKKEEEKNRSSEKQNESTKPKKQKKINLVDKPEINRSFNNEISQEKPKPKKMIENSALTKK